MALYREATQRSEDGLTVDIQDEIPVDQAVPIGTKLQLRATINDNSGNRWYLMWFFKKKKSIIMQIRILLCHLQGRIFDTVFYPHISLL